VSTQLQLYIYIYNIIYQILIRIRRKRRCCSVGTECQCSIHVTNDVLNKTYRISRPIRRTFPRKYERNSTCVLCAEGIIHKLINTRTSIIQYLHRDYYFRGSDDDFLGFYYEYIILWLLILVCNNPVFFQNITKIKINL
jgi:hypothetical protein